MSSFTHNGFTITRLHFEGNSPSIGADGLSDTIVWAVDSTPVNVLLSDLLTVLGAERFVAHPDYAGIVVNTVSVVPDGYGCKITVSYTVPEHVDTEVDDTAAEGYYDIDTTFQDESVTLPIYQKVTKTFGEEVVQDVYQRVQDVSAYGYKKSVNRIVLNAEVPSDAGVTTQLGLVQYLNEHNNKLHKINGDWYLFEVDGVRRMSPEVYQFTYRWTYDPGIPFTLNNMNIEGQFAIRGSYHYPLSWVVGDTEFAEFVPDTSENWMVLPHHRLDVSTSGVPTDVPLVDASPKYLVGSTPGGDGDGYLLLPGVTS